jgi:GNAT superfamily N-acetyltransferase
MMLLSAQRGKRPTTLPDDVAVRLDSIIESLVARTLLVFDDDARVVGTVMLDVFPSGEVELHEIYIARTFRKHGYGTRVLRAVDQMLIEEGARQLWLYPHSTDGVATDALVRWYTRCGFINDGEAGMIKHYR